MADQATHLPNRKLIAPLWHTGVLVGFLMALAGYGAYLQLRAGSGPELVETHPSTLPLYLSLIVAEWGLLRFVFVGVRKGSGTRLRDLIGGRWSRWQDVLRDIAIAGGVWALCMGLESLAEHGLGPDTAKGITTLLPRGPLEISAWTALSLSAGFCEEAVFRGYLQRQMEALTGSVPLAVAIQAVIFGISHGYQGLRPVITITILGVLYGGLAHWRRSLRPGMALHAWMDIFGGLISSRG